VCGKVLGFLCLNEFIRSVYNCARTQRRVVLKSAEGDPVHGAYTVLISEFLQFIFSVICYCFSFNGDSSSVRQFIILKRGKWSRDSSVGIATDYGL
jgi:hypothetical protein